jgi:MFS family permease
VPYVVRAVLLVLTFVVAWRSMYDVGFTPKPRTSVVGEMRGIVRSSLDHGLLNPPVRWLMLAAPFGAGISVYGFYAAQPYLLELYGKEDSYAIAGVSAALVAGALIVGGALVGQAARFFHRRTSLLLAATAATAGALVLVGTLTEFWVALVLIGIWAVLFAMMTPVRQALLNGLIPSAQRATVLSSDNMLSSAGGVVAQPALGKAADVWSYGTSYVISAFVQLLALPFLLLARREGAVSDPIEPRSAGGEVLPGEHVGDGLDHPAAGDRPGLERSHLGGDDLVEHLVGRCE